MKIFLLFIFAFVQIISTASAQDTKKLADAQRSFAIKSYEKALPLFLDAIQSGVKDPVTYYQTGVCYQKMQNIDDQVKGIPYFEKALSEGKGLSPTLP